MTRYPWIRQESGEDCAAASLATVALHHGLDLSIDRVREAVSMDSGGASVASLRRGAESLGFLTKVIQATPAWLDHLDSATLPAIIYWKGYHLLALYGRQGDKFVVADPALGIRYLTREELEDGWQGRVVLLLRPHPIRFHLQRSGGRSPYRNLFRRLAPYRALWAVITALGAVTAAVSIGLPLLLERLVDDVLLPGGGAASIPIGIAIGAWVLLRGAAEWARSMLVGRLAQRLATSTSREFGLQLLHLPLSYYESRNSALVRHRLADLQRVASVITGLVADLPRFVLVAVAGMAVLGAYDLRVLAVAGCGALAAVLAVVFALPIARQAGIASAAATGESYFLLSQFFSNALTLRALGAASTLESDLDDTLQAEARANTRNMHVAQSAWAVTELMAGLSIAAVLWATMVLAFRLELTPGQLVAVIGLSLIVIKAITSTVVWVMNAAEVRADTRLLEDVFLAAPDGSRVQGPESRVQGDAPKVDADLSEVSAQADVAFEHVSFQYPGRRPLFQELSVRLPGGSVSAIVGESGSGKTTLAWLMAGLLAPRAGRIALGDADMAGLSSARRAKLVGVVPQEARFLTRSIADNLRLGAVAATDDQIAEACRLCAADAFVRELPEGYQTVIGDFSAKLSTGEKQRLALARALVLDPAVLILDESTSGLDRRTEAEVLDRVLNARRGKTTVLVSHRPEVIERAEWIIVLEHGRVRFAGPREALGRV